jgi:putative intracellular protease/amidase
MVDSDGDQKALVICHAVGLLAFTRDSNGGFPVDGRNVTGFPDEWEENIVDDGLMPDGQKFPYWVEDEVIAAGGNWDVELDSDTSVTVDGDLVTTRGPDSSHEGVMALIEALGVTPPA